VGEKTGEMKKAPCDTKYMRKKTEHFLKSKSWAFSYYAGFFKHVLSEKK